MLELIMIIVEEEMIDNPNAKHILDLDLPTEDNSVSPADKEFLYL